MPTPALRRHLRRRRDRRATGLRPWLPAGVVALVAVLAMAPTVLARPTASQAPAGLLPSVVPSVCVGGVVLCGGSVITQPALPTPCVAGVLLCSPLPSILPSNPVIGPSQGPVASPGQTPPTARPSPSNPIPGNPGPGPGGGSAVAAPLPAPPGVGLVPPQQVVTDAGLAPDSFATLLSLSMRDGLSSGRYHVWPWLLGIQLVLWTVLAGVARFRHPSTSPGARRS